MANAKGKINLDSLAKEGSLKECANYRTISLISKIMLRVFLRRLSSQIEPLLTEEQTGFRKGRSSRTNIQFACDM